jgi:hypothetical protein
MPYDLAGGVFSRAVAAGFGPDSVVTVRPIRATCGQIVRRGKQATQSPRADGYSMAATALDDGLACGQALPSYRSSIGVELPHACRLLERCEVNALFGGDDERYFTDHRMIHEKWRLTMGALNQATPPAGEGKSGEWREHDGIWWYWSDGRWEPGPSDGAKLAVADDGDVQ